jgi:hypothetical protein
MLRFAVRALGVRHHIRVRTEQFSVAEQGGKNKDGFAILPARAVTVRLTPATTYERTVIT